jgi:tetratricopeptide (TPR) repeat protein
VQLFVQCARRTKPAFDLASEGPAVVRICQLVNGMPLGIEMAAAWLKFYGCTQIAQEITRSLDFLATSLRNVPVRHRSMRAVFAHSWSLLSAEEQSVFARLAVFRGGFTQEAAEAVVGAPTFLLLALVEKSLLQLTPSNRFHLHELLRQFGEEKLRTQPQTRTATHDHHCRYYTTLLQRQEARLKGPEQRTTMVALNAEIENIRAAWQWAVAQQKVDELDQAVECLNTLYLTKSWLNEGVALFEETATALAMDEPVGKQGILLGKVLAKQANMLEAIIVLVGGSTSWEKVERIYHQSLTILQQLNVPEETAFVLSGLSARCWITGGFEQSLQLNQQALTLFAEQGNRWEMSRVLTELGIIYYCVGDYRQAIDYCRQAITLCEAIGEPCRLSESWRVLANFHLAAGEHAEARQAAQTALTIATSVDYKQGIAWAWQVLGDLGWRMNEYALAQQHAQASIAVSQEIGFTRLQGAAISILGNVACSLGDYPQARTHFCTVLAANAASRLNSAWIIADAVIGMATILVKQGQPVQGIEMLFHVLNTASILHEAKDRAQRLLAEFATELPPDIVAAGQARMQGRDLQSAVAELLREATISR